MSRFKQEVLVEGSLTFIEIEPMKWTPDGLSVFKYERIRMERLNLKEIKRIFSGMKKMKVSLAGTDTFIFQKGRGPPLMIKDGKIGIREEDNSNCENKLIRKKAFLIIDKLAMEGLLVNPKIKRVFFKRAGMPTRRKFNPNFRNPRF